MTRVVSVLAVILTPLLWPIGVALLWLSPAWSASSKAIGTFVIPGGLALAAFLELGDRSSCPLDSTTGCAFGPTYGLLHPADASFNHVFGALVFTATVVLPLAAAMYLAMTLRSKWAEI